MLTSSSFFNRLQFRGGHYKFQHSSKPWLFSLFAQFAKVQAQSEKLIQSHFKKMTNAKDYTLAVAKLMPGTLHSFKPVEGEMSFGEQLVYIS